MPAVLSIVGKSGSGKTTLIEKLIPPLKQQGYRIGVVKHAHHGFSMDHKGKDSDRHRQAGADTVMVAASGQIALIKATASAHLDDLIPYFNDVDLLFTEGFKRNRAPKIEVFRSTRHRHPACLEDDTLVAMVTDTPFHRALPQFAPDDIAAISAFIVARLLSHR